MTDAYAQLLEGVLDELGRTLRAVSPVELQTFQETLLAAPRIFAVGRGRSGLYIRAFAMRLMHLGLMVHVVDDVTTPAIQNGDLLVIASGSGRTATLLQHANKAKGLGAKIALVTAFPNSPIGELADLTVHIPAPSVKDESTGQPASVQPMANLFEQSLALMLDMVAILLMRELGQSGEQMFARHANLE